MRRHGSRSFVLLARSKVAESCLLSQRDTQTGKVSRPFWRQNRSSLGGGALGKVQQAREMELDEMVLRASHSFIQLLHHSADFP